MINNRLILNLYENKYSKKKISTQLLYGDKFKIINRFNNILKIAKNKSMIGQNYNDYMNKYLIKLRKKVGFFNY